MPRSHRTGTSTAVRGAKRTAACEVPRGAAVQRTRVERRALHFDADSGCGPPDAAARTWPSHDALRTLHTHVAPRTPHPALRRFDLVHNRTLGSGEAT